MTEIRLVATDLDGTLLTSQGVLATEGARLLREAVGRGVRVVLATSRVPDSTTAFCRLLGIDEPIICTDGTQVWASPSGPVWAHHPFSQEVASVIARMADDNDWELSTTVGLTTCYRRRPGQNLGQVAPNRTIVASNSDAVTGDPVRILARDPEAIEALRSLCWSEFADQCRTDSYYSPDGMVQSLGIFALEADKGTALAMVLDRLRIRPEQAMAIGDNLNDLPMFALAQTSVAMSNAPNEVRQGAGFVAPGNDQEGVAWALREFGVSP